MKEVKEKPLCSVWSLPPIFQEVESTNEKPKMSKAIVIDIMQPEVLKEGGTVLARRLAEIFAMIWIEWETAFLIPVLKGEIKLQQLQGCDFSWFKILESVCVRVCVRVTV